LVFKQSHFSAYRYVELTLSNLKEIGLTPCTLPLELIGNELPARRGHGVFPIGNPNGVAWQFPVAPDQVTEVNENNTIFQSSVIESEHSGGGLFNAFGDLIGKQHTRQGHRTR
jgi:S1-C subfamily serine protease